MKKRDSKFELLRIISMAMIILCHYGLYGENSSRYLKGLAPLGQIGVGIFVMISAYFLTEEKRTKSKLLKRILTLWARVIFYSWLILCIDLSLGFTLINKKNLIKSIFPIIANNYWFVTSFLVLMFIVPFLNKIIQDLNKEQYMLSLVVIIVFSGVTPIIGQPFTPFGQELNVGVMISEYLLVGYYKKYNIQLNNYILLMGGILFYIGELISNKSNGFPAIILSAIIFILFIQISPSYYNSCINWIASSVFASYLITENVLFRMTFWKLATSVFVFQSKLLEGIIITVVTILLTVLIDKIYLFFFNFLIKEKLNILAKELTFKLGLG
ncbi:acyltransferase family protein [Limosilactobacillus reuteri]|uniref:acyltransferase family protein n=1 Tax=Limosilactobacillus reuteri TaxID=1598 RepID=UPI003D005CE4